MKRILCALLTLVLLCGTVVPALAAEEAEPSFFKEKMKIGKNGYLVELESTIVAVTENFEAMWVSETEEVPIPSEKISVHVNEDSRLEIVTQRNGYASCVFLPGSFLMADGSVNEEPIPVEFHKDFTYSLSFKPDHGRLEECLILPRSVESLPGHCNTVYVEGETAHFSILEYLDKRMQVQYGDTISEPGDMACTVSGEGEQACAFLLDGICVEEYAFRVLPKKEADKIFRNDRFWRNTAAALLCPGFPFYVLTKGAVRSAGNWLILMIYTPSFNILLQPVIAYLSVSSGVKTAYEDWKELFQKLSTPYSWES